MANDNIGKIPPHSMEAEQNVLGILLLKEKYIDTSVEMINIDDFYNPAHQKIYQAILNIYNKQAIPDLLTVPEELRRLGHLDEVGGYSYIADLTDKVVVTLNIEYYLKIVKDKSILRKIIEASSSSLNLAYEDSEEVQSILEHTEKAIYDINQDSHSKGLVFIGEVLEDTFKKMEERSHNVTDLTGITTGFTDLNRKLSGLQKSDLVLLAARPSMGKTALMVNLAVNAALKDHKVAVFSLEMSENQLAQRMISSISHVDLAKVISGNLETDEWTKVLKGTTMLQSLNIYIDDTAGISPLELKSKARRLKAQKGLDLIVIDYLQLMEIKSGKSENRTQEISAISRSLKAIAKELEVPVVALSQLSRATELRGDKRPILSDLRESGAIEQDADVVMFLYRDEYYNKDTEKRNVGEVIIAKHRNGPTGVVELTFLPEFTKFVDMARE